jgi:uncharacterized protein (DUF488 family)
MSRLRIYTVGHSTRSMEELLDLLREQGIQTLIDVRRFPGSRRHPQFAQDALAASIASAAMEYMHVVELGGRRSGGAGSPNTAWRNASFRAYADYMSTPPFRAALRRVAEHASRSTSALMCAEALPFRCHRRLISDALVARGAEVIHILGPRRCEPHQMHPHAQVLDDGRLLYQEPDASQLELLPTEPERSLPSPRL